MKKFIISTLAVLSLVSSGKIDMYPETGKVVDISNNMVTVETFSGNQFQFEGVEDWLVGDIASMIMYGNNTDNVEDDQIVKVRYSGYVEG